MADVDTVVVGGGVVGLACARSLALAGHDVLLLERHNHIGEETSSRNSEVIHAGIYYPEGSNKARLCVRGKRLLYEFCRAYNVDYRNCGKIIVASDNAQSAVLQGYQDQAQANGVHDLEPLSAAQVFALEPEVKAVAGLLSPSTGIIDSHGFMLTVQGQFERAGGIVAFGTEVTDLVQRDRELLITTDGYELTARVVVNCAGHGAPALAGRLLSSIPSAYFARGHYYGYQGKPPFSRLVYPIAEAGGLGVHVTLDLAGQIKFGPDVEWVDKLDYRFDDGRREAFAEAIGRYFPAVRPDRLEPGYVGIRPKITGPGEPAADFCIEGEAEHGVRGFVNLLGIESPGLTASLAIAEEVAAFC